MTNQSELRETAVLFANRIGSPWGEGATYDRSRTEPEDPDDIDEDDRKPSGKLYSHLSDEDFDLFVADFVAYITANYTPINQPSTNTTPVTDSSSGKWSTKDEIEFRLRMADVPEKYIEIAANSTEHLVAERERLARVGELSTPYSNGMFNRMGDAYYHKRISELAKDVTKPSK